MHVNICYKFEDKEHYSLTEYSIAKIALLILNPTNKTSITHMSLMMYNL